MIRSNRPSLVKIVIPVLVVLLLSVSVYADRTELVIVHQNDFHGHLESFDFERVQRGGIARLAGLVDQLRAQYDGRVLWLDGGDTWHGTTLANLWYGESVVDAFNVAGLDAMVLGNHEFNYEQDILRQRIAQAQFAVLSANTIFDTDGTSIADPYVILDVDGLKVGVIGLTTPTTAWAASPINVRNLTFKDPIVVLNELLPEVRAQADLVVLLTHLGHDEDQLIAEKVSGIDVIVGGHSHSLVPKPVVVGDTVIVQANEYGKYLGVLRLVVEDGRIVEHDGHLIEVTRNTSAHPQVAQVVEKWKANLAGELERVIGETAIHLEGQRSAVRTRQTNFGYLVADSMRSIAGTEIGWINGGAIRASIPAGKITVGDIYTALPFENTLVGIELSGATIREALDHSHIAYRQEFGGYLQLAGIEFSFDPNRPIGQRIFDVTVNGEPLDDDRIYTVATTDFLYHGGDAYDMLVGSNIIFGSAQSDGFFIRDAFVEYLKLGIIE